MLPIQSPLARAVLGDREALVLLLRRYGPAARKAIAGRIPARWRSVLSEDDVLQQTYADATRAIRQFTSPEERAFGAWLAQTARRNLLDALKLLRAEKRGGLRQRIASGGSDDSYAALSQMIVGKVTSPSRHLARKEAVSALRRAIRKLPQDYANAVRLYDLEGRPAQEVAAALKRSPGAVFMLRARAHERLGEIIGRGSGFLTTTA